MMKVVDMHYDTILKLYDDLHHGKEGSLLENDGHIDLKKMQKGNYLLQNFAMLVDVCRLRKILNLFLKAINFINYYYHEIENILNSLNLSFVIKILSTINKQVSCLLF